MPPKKTATKTTKAGTPRKKPGPKPKATTTIIKEVLPALPERARLRFVEAKKCMRASSKLASQPNKRGGVEERSAEYAQKAFDALIDGLFLTFGIKEE